MNVGVKEAYFCGYSEGQKRERAPLTLWQLRDTKQKVGYFLYMKASVRVLALRHNCRINSADLFQNVWKPFLVATGSSPSLLAPTAHRLRLKHCSFLRLVLTKHVYDEEIKVHKERIKHVLVYWWQHIVFIV